MSDFGEIHLVKQADGRMLPATDGDLALWRKIPVGKQMACKFRFPRNPEFHNQTWVMREWACDHWPQAPRPTPHALNQWLKRKTGLVTEVRDPITGEVTLEPDSTRYDSMPDADYRAWWKEALEVLAFVFGCTPQELGDELDGVKSWGKCPNPKCNNLATEWHHIFGGTFGRERSEVLGYKIKICHDCNMLSEGSLNGPDQETWERLWCGLKGLDWETARRKIHQGGKVYRLKYNKGESRGT